MNTNAEYMVLKVKLVYWMLGIVAACLFVTGILVGAFLENNRGAVGAMLQTEVVAIPRAIAGPITTIEPVAVEVSKAPEPSMKPITDRQELRLPLSPGTYQLPNGSTIEVLGHVKMPPTGPRRAADLFRGATAADYAATEACNASDQPDGTFWHTLPDKRTPRLANICRWH